MPRPRIEFWYDFASTYSYLSALRIDAMAATAGCDVIWRPFLLGPIFKAQGWTSSPFNLYPAKGRYMLRDLDRIARSRGRVFRMPEAFPAHSLLAARLALAIADAKLPAFTMRVFLAAFETGADIARRDVLEAILSSLDIDAATAFAAAGTSGIKEALRYNCTTAADRGIFGAPSFIAADGELFWGDDRLEHALAWAGTVSAEGNAQP